MPKERSFKWQPCEENPHRISAGKSESQSCWNDRYTSSAPGGLYLEAYIWMGDLTASFLRYRFGGLKLWGLFSNFTVC